MKWLHVLFFLSVGVYSVQGQPHAIQSPNGNIRIEFTLGGFEDGQAHESISDAPFYRVFVHDKPFILASRLGFEISGAPVFYRFFKTANRSTIGNRYMETETNTLTIIMK